MDQAKIQLSADELQLVSNAGWLLTKNRIIEKVYFLFGELSEQLKPLTDKLPSEVRSISPKISKGEKYKELPYVMLDYPRYFEKEEVFAVRTFFWWGNFFSVTLHLKGEYQQKLVKRLQQKAEELQAAGFRLYLGDDEWDHSFDEDKYEMPATHMRDRAISKLTERSFYKLSSRVNFDRWDEMKENLFRLHQALHQAIGS